LEIDAFDMKHRERNFGGERDAPGDHGDVRQPGARAAEPLVQVQKEHEPRDRSKDRSTALCGPEYLGFPGDRERVGEELHRDLQPHSGEQAFDQEVRHCLENVLCEVVLPHDRLEARGEKDEPRHVRHAELVNAHGEHRREPGRDAGHSDVVPRPDQVQQVTHHAGHDHRRQPDLHRILGHEADADGERDGHQAGNGAGHGVALERALRQGGRIRGVVVGQRCRGVVGAGGQTVPHGRPRRIQDGMHVRVPSDARPHGTRTRLVWNGSRTTRTDGNGGTA
jgi:hypothetical protein